MIWAREWQGWDGDRERLRTNPTFLRKKGKGTNNEGAVPFQGYLKEKGKDTTAKKNQERSLQMAQILEQSTGPKCSEKCHQREMDRVERKGAF